MQQIIVYRNPLEAALWESVMNGDAFIMILVIAALAALWVGAYTLSCKLERKWMIRNIAYKRFMSPKWSPWIAFAVTVAAAIGLHLYNVHG